MEPLKALNAALAFAIEIAMLGSLGYGGYHVTHQAILRWVLALGLPAVVIAIWGAWMAPNSQSRIDQPYRSLVQLVLFTLAAVLLYKAGKPTQALVFGAIAYINTFIAYLWKQ